MDLPSNSPNRGSYYSQRLDIILPDTLCRVCLRSDSNSNLIRVCLCNNSKSHVHKNCVIRELRDNNARRCGHCAYRICVDVHEKNVSQWAIEPEIRSGLPEIAWALFYHLFILLTLGACSVTLLVHYHRHSANTPNPSFLVKLKLPVGIILFIGLLCFAFFISSYYYKLYSTIRCYNNPVIDVYRYTGQHGTSSGNQKLTSFMELFSKYSSK